VSARRFAREHSVPAIPDRPASPRTQPTPTHCAPSTRRSPGSRTTSARQSCCASWKGHQGPTPR
jgi:hypothetical protein